MNQEAKKKQAAVSALAYVKNDMHIGLGTGTTMEYFLKALGQKIEEGLQVAAYCSSQKTQAAARAYHILLLPKSFAQTLNVYIDGVDQLDEKGKIIKGGGGALVREKLLHQWADQTIWIMDDKKLVKHCEHYPLPVEILPFAVAHFLSYLKKQGYQPSLRLHEGVPYISDNGNYIVDVLLPSHQSLAAAHSFLLEQAAVVQTGYFYDMKSICIIASAHGVRIQPVRDIVVSDA